MSGIFIKIEKCEDILQQTLNQPFEVTFVSCGVKFFTLDYKIRQGQDRMPRRQFQSQLAVLKEMG